MVTCWSGPPSTIGSRAGPGSNGSEIGPLALPALHQAQMLKAMCLEVVSGYAWAKFKELRNYSSRYWFHRHDKLNILPLRDGANQKTKQLPKFLQTSVLVTARLASAGAALAVSTFETLSFASVCSSSTPASPRATMALSTRFSSSSRSFSTII